MSWPEVDATVRQRHVVLSAGTVIEPCGPHLPFDADKVRRALADIPRQDHRVPEARDRGHVWASQGMGLLGEANGV